MSAVILASKVVELRTRRAKDMESMRVEPFLESATDASALARLARTKRVANIGDKKPLVTREFFGEWVAP